MSQRLFDDLARLSATPMSRAKALRLMGRAIVGAVVTAIWAPRSVFALNCSQTVCAPATPNLCCVDAPFNPNASISGCCKPVPTERCCKFFTPEGGSFASVACCGPTEVCTKLNPPMEAAYCVPCGPNPVVCGTEPCCPTDYVCIANACCPVQQACGAVCCPTGQSCVNGTCTAQVGPCQFTDNPLTAGTSIKAVHITELRPCINAIRAQQALSTFVFTDASLTGIAVKATHILELRTALRGAYVAAGRAVPVYTDPTLTAQTTAIKAVHIQELRAAVLAF
jgi:hypothetical protein